MVATQESITAKLCSFARAYHSNHCRQKIFDDYLAYSLMGREEYDEIGQLIEHDFVPGQYDPARSFRKEAVCQKLAGAFASIPLSRMAFAELRLARFAEQHGVCQYVICGAGMDTFAFRNENPDIRVFEIDHPDTQSYKLGRIEELEWNIPRGVRYVPVDFETDQLHHALSDAGFQPEIPTFFSILGVAYYLTLSTFEETVEDIAALSSAGSLLVFDYPDETIRDGSRHSEHVRRLTEITRALGEEMIGGYPYPALRGALERHGFAVERRMTPEEIQREFFAHRADGYRAFEAVHFISAVLKKEDQV